MQHELACAKVEGQAHPEARIEYFRDRGSTLAYSPAVGTGDLVFLSGQVGQDMHGQVPDGIEAQARLVMENVASTARRAGLRMDQIVKVTVMMTDMRNWATFNAIYKEYFETDRLPARSAFGVTELAMRAVVEVDCIAARISPGRRSAATSLATETTPPNRTV